MTACCDQRFHQKEAGGAPAWLVRLGVALPMAWLCLSAVAQRLVPDRLAEQAFSGHALVIVRGRGGAMKLRAQADGLKAGEVVLRTANGP